MQETVLVTEQEYRKAEAIFSDREDFRVEAAAGGERELAEAVARRGARAAIVGVERYEGPLYEALAATAGGRGAIVARFGVGHDGIDKRQAARLGIYVTNAPGALDASVAEHAMWLIGALARRVCRLESLLRGGRFASTSGIEVCGKTLGVVGFGAIGRRVARIARLGFGMKIAAADCLSEAELEKREGRPIADFMAAEGLEFYTDRLDDLLAQSDIVSLHVAATPQTRNLIDADRLRTIKLGAMLVNTSRGSVVDEAALYDAVASGHLGGAALDVFQVEPYRPVSAEKDLRKLDRVVLTPHIGSNTAEANNRMAAACLKNVAAFFAGKFDELTQVDR
ncbi:MAG: hypothetical protein JW959_09785 [Pirellulales bacterium]|nr:hypothetical protein [Pirellulales bacterium]